MDAPGHIRQLLEDADGRVLQVKLADRTHSMRTIAGCLSIAKQQQMAEVMQKQSARLLLRHYKLVYCLGSCGIT